MRSIFKKILTYNIVNCNQYWSTTIFKWDEFMEQKLRRDRNMGTNLRKLRLDYNISQEKLCAELQRKGCDIGRSTYEKYETGELNIRISVLIALKEIYKCSYDDFFNDL